MWEMNLRKDEYNQIQKGLTDYHEDTIISIKAVIKDIESLLKDSNDFNIEQTGKNLQALLDVIKQDVLSLAETTFQESEQCIDTIVNGINNIDTVC